MTISHAANIGAPIREIIVQPKELPIPQTLPAIAPPARVKAPAEEPVPA